MEGFRGLLKSPLGNLPHAVQRENGTPGLRASRNPRMPRFACKRLPRTPIWTGAGRAGHGARECRATGSPRTLLGRSKALCRKPEHRSQAQGHWPCTRPMEQQIARNWHLYPANAGECHLQGIFARDDGPGTLFTRTMRTHCRFTGFHLVGSAALTTTCTVPGRSISTVPKDIVR